MVHITNKLGEGKEEIWKGDLEDTRRDALVDRTTRLWWMRLTPFKTNINLEPLPGGIGEKPQPTDLQAVFFTILQSTNCLDAIYIMHAA